MNNTTMIARKQCLSCLEIKSLDEFHKCKKGYLKRKSVCKKCRNKTDKILKSEGKMIEGIFHKKCTECNQFLPLEQFNKSNSHSYGVFPKCKKCLHDLRTTNEYRNKRNEREVETGKRKLSSHKYYLENKDKVKIIVHRRYSKKKTLISTLTKEDWEESENFFNHECAYCGIKTQDLQQEHIVPVYCDGHYTKQNIIPACQKCNFSKNNRMLEDWYPNQDFFEKERLNRIYKWMGFDNKNKMQQIAFF